jgi:hypothetical protein
MPPSVPGSIPMPASGTVPTPAVLPGGIATPTPVRMTPGVGGWRRGSSVW